MEGDELLINFQPSHYIEVPLLGTFCKFTQHINCATHSLLGLGIGLESGIFIDL